MRLLPFWRRVDRSLVDSIFEVLKGNDAIERFLMARDLFFQRRRVQFCKATLHEMCLLSLPWTHNDIIVIFREDPRLLQHSGDV